MDLRTSVMLAGSGGLIAACAASLLLMGKADAKAIAALDERVAAVSARPLRASADAGGLPILVNAPPLFPVLAGPNAPPEVAVHLEGLVKSPGRIAALVSINGGPALWLRRGETVDGVTLEAVGANTVTIDTPHGSRDLRLGEGAAPPAGPAQNAAVVETPLPGLRQPPEPASAPRAGP